MEHKYTVLHHQKTTAKKMTAKTKGKEKEIIIESKKGLPGWKQFYIHYVTPLLDFVSMKCPPGPCFIPCCYVVNFFKGATLPFGLALMTYYQVSTSILCTFIMRMCVFLIPNPIANGFVTNRHHRRLLDTLTYHNIH